MRLIRIAGVTTQNWIVATDESAWKSKLPDWKIATTVCLLDIVHIAANTKRTRAPEQEALFETRWKKVLKSSNSDSERM